MLFGGTPARSARRPRRIQVAVVLGATVIAGLAITPAKAQTWIAPQPTYRLNDTGGGRVLSILPPGEHGLYNAADLGFSNHKLVYIGGVASQVVNAR